MDQLVGMGAACHCSFGMAPSTLAFFHSDLAAATIMDFAPLVNISSFGLCLSEANPTVAAATASAMGVMTPMPCIPATTNPWEPGSSTVIVDGQPALTASCICTCACAGVIQIVDPGTVPDLTPDPVWDAGAEPVSDLGEAVDDVRAEVPW